ncbi:MAG TPA: hypothetical protein VKD21_17385 [Acidimicrobiales bacterium]|nr:hypothetical protein [Acidimicrobiales bacterium]
MVSGILGIVVAVLAVACGWLAWRAIGTRQAVRGADGRVRAAVERAAIAESELAAAEERTAKLEASVSALTSERAGWLVERHELRQAHERGTTAYGRLESDLARARADHAAAVEALTQQRNRLSSAERATAEAAVRTSEYQALLSTVDGSASGTPGASWAILLAILARRWAGVVGALPDARGVRSGTVPEQLEEALVREGERLREEVGVDVDVHTADLLEPADPVSFLLAATDLLGVLAAVCEQVTIELDRGLVLTGLGWSGPTDELDLARSRAVAAGVPADDLVVDDEDESVTVTLRPRATATA